MTIGKAICLRFAFHGSQLIQQNNFFFCKTLDSTEQYRSDFHDWGFFFGYIYKFVLNTNVSLHYYSESAPFIFIRS